jgi:hypothetical protein
MGPLTAAPADQGGNGSIAVAPPLLRSDVAKKQTLRALVKTTAKITHKRALAEHG